jgi:hypothetical protein
MTTDVTHNRKKGKEAVSKRMTPLILRRGSVFHSFFTKVKDKYLMFILFL